MFRKGADDRFPDRLPIHLLYDFHLPGTYEVRYVAQDLLDFPLSDHAVIGSSAWTRIEIQPRQPGRHKQWLADLKRRAPMDAGELLEDTLPNLLGIPDDASLEILLGYLYHPNSAVREYVFHGLGYWPDTEWNSD